MIFSKSDSKRDPVKERDYYGADKKTVRRCKNNRAISFTEIYLTRATVRKPLKNGIKALVALPFDMITYPIRSIHFAISWYDDKDYYDMGPSRYHYGHTGMLATALSG
jgi:hypothetical protein